jgi:hypothetical protein
MTHRVIGAVRDPLPRRRPPGGVWLETLSLSSGGLATPVLSIVRKLTGTDHLYKSVP